MFGNLTLSLVARLSRRPVIAALFFCAVAMVVSGGAQAAENNSSDDIIKAVVGITALIPENARTAEHLGTIRSGSGVVIGEDGLVLTIGYLILEAVSAAVTDADGALVPAAVLGYDHNSGFGLLRAEQPLGIKPVELGSSADLAEGAPVIVLSKGGRLPVMPAKVGSRRVFAGYWEYLLENAIFTVPPNPQYGGAALIDGSGRLVGIGSLIVNDAIPRETPVPGNMFVPIDMLKPILSDMLAKGRANAPSHPWLGLYTDDSQGRVLVIRVADGGPAAKMGIKPGDIIMGIGGKRVKGLADFYRKIWARGDAGAEIPLDLVSPAAGNLDIRTVTVQSQDRYDWLKLDKGL